ncbi:MAG: hypothetical protein CSA07_00470 [Bacteroidia bacterium]|nr:MAG: hypothetical protein CSA07_00470 [Bacteroidia bacterium]
MAQEAPRAEVDEAPVATDGVQTPVCAAEPPAVDAPAMELEQVPSVAPGMDEAPVATDGVQTPACAVEPPAVDAPAMELEQVPSVAPGMDEAPVATDGVQAPACAAASPAVDAPALELEQVPSVAPGMDATPEEAKVSEAAELEEGNELDSLDPLSFAELVALMEAKMAEPITAQLRMAVEDIKTVFYRKVRAQHEEERRQYDRAQREAEEAGAGGEGDEGFTPSSIAELPRFQELYSQFKEAKNAHRRRVEQEQEQNLVAKRRIIDEILALTTRAEVKGATFNEFDELRKQWKEVGFVPQREVDNLYKSYTHAVEQFFDYLNINRELRDLDHKKNFDAKTALCNRAEELIVMPDPVEAFRRLQDLHAQWKEIGPVMREKSDEIWERFSAATARINTRHREHFEALKVKYEENLVRKEALCAELEELLARERSALKQWFQDSERVVAMQQEWRKIGPVPRKHNARIWDRFQELCEKFFTGRREFEKGVRAEGQVNIQKKLDLCVQAEALKDSQDWSATTKELIELQNQWKQVGYTPYKKGNELWTRFRTAMDFFFEARNKAQASARDSQRENLKLKQAIIEELRAYQPGEDVQVSVEWLKQIQNRWSEIGFVPFKQKDAVQQQYRKEIDRLYDMLRVDRLEQNMETFKTRVDGMKGQDDGALSREKSRLNAKVRALEAEKRQMENNLSFFSSSSSDNPVLSRFQSQLEGLDQEIALLREKMKHVDKAAKEDSAEE